MTNNLTQDPFDSIERCLAFHVRDWSTEKRDAWLYGVVMGWDDAAMTELVERHGWSDDTVTRLRKLHGMWKIAKAQMQKSTTKS